MHQSLCPFTRTAVVLALSVCVCSQALLRIPIGVLTSKANRTCIVAVSVQKAPGDARRDGFDILKALIGTGLGWSLADGLGRSPAALTAPVSVVSSFQRAPLGPRPPPAAAL